MKAKRNPTGVEYYLSGVVLTWIMAMNVLLLWLGDPWEEE